MPRPLKDQTVVITGASSGIGRQTAIEFARRGAALMLAARDEAALRELTDQLQPFNGKTHYQVTDVSQRDQVQRLAQEADARLGRIDTWINNASVTEYATVEEMTIEEIERIIQVNLLGAIYGVKAVLPYMKQQGEGTIINIASVLAMRSVPYQAAYCAAKHGLKGFSESLRLELKHAHSGIHVTLILPSSINTPLFTHARSKLGVKPMPIPPIYEPQTVAEAILFAAEHPRRQIIVGGAGKLLTLLERISPSLADWYMLQGGRMFRQQRTDQPDDGRDNLYAPMEGLRETRGEFGEHAHATSPYTRYLETHPLVAGGLLVGSLLAAAGLAFRSGAKPTNSD